MAIIGVEYIDGVSALESGSPLTPQSGWGGSLNRSGQRVAVANERIVKAKFFGRGGSASDAFVTALMEINSGDGAGSDGGVASEHQFLQQIDITCDNSAEQIFEIDLDIPLTEGVRYGIANLPGSISNGRYNYLEQASAAYDISGGSTTTFDQSEYTTSNSDSVIYVWYETNLSDVENPGPLPSGVTLDQNEVQSVTVTYEEDLSFEPPNTNLEGYYITQDGVDYPLIDGSVQSSNTLLFFMEAEVEIYEGRTITLSYVNPGDGPLSASEYVPAEDFVDISVINNSTTEAPPELIIGKRALGSTEQTPQTGWQPVTNITNSIIAVPNQYVTAVGFNGRSNSNAGAVRSALAEIVDGEPVHISYYETSVPSALAEGTETLETLNEEDQVYLTPGKQYAYTLAPGSIPNGRFYTDDVTDGVLNLVGGLTTTIDESYPESTAGDAVPTGFFLTEILIKPLVSAPSSGDDVEAFSTLRITGENFNDSMSVLLINSDETKEDVLTYTFVDSENIDVDFNPSRFKINEECTLVVDTFNIPITIISTADSTLVDINETPGTGVGYLNPPNPLVIGSQVLHTNDSISIDPDAKVSAVGAPPLSFSYRYYSQTWSDNIDVSVEDASGDTVEPVATLSGIAGIVSGQNTLTITWSEPVTGFNSDYISITEGSVGTLSGTPGGSVYTIPITVPETGTGTVTVSVLPSAARDSVGNTNSVPFSVDISYDSQGLSVVSASVSEDGLSINVGLSKVHTASAQAYEGFSVYSGGVEVISSSVSGSGTDSIAIGIDSVIYTEDEVTLDYSAQVDSIEDDVTPPNTLQEFSAYSVVNQSTIPTPADVIPDQFDLGLDVINATVDTTINRQVTITGIEEAVLAVSTGSAEVSLDGSTYSTQVSVENDGDLFFRLTTSSSYEDTVTGGIVINGVSDSISATTEIEPSSVPVILSSPASVAHGEGFVLTLRNPLVDPVSVTISGQQEEYSYVPGDLSISVLSGWGDGTESSIDVVVTDSTGSSSALPLSVVSSDLSISSSVLTGNVSSGYELLVTFSEDVQYPDTSLLPFFIQSSSGSYDLSFVSMSGSSVVFEVLGSFSAYAGQSLSLVSLNSPSYITDTSGQGFSSFTSLVITNNSTETAPTSYTPQEVAREVALLLDVPTAQEVAAQVASVLSVPTVDQIVDALIARADEFKFDPSTYTVESNESLVETIRLMRSVLVGTTIIEGAKVSFMSADGSKARVISTNNTELSGTRSTVAIDRE